VISACSKAEEEDAEEMVDILLVGAEGVNAEALSEDKTSEYTGSVCRVWWDV